MATVQVQFGGRNGTVHDLETAEDLVVVRTQDKQPVTTSRLSAAASRLLDDLEPVTRFREAGVEVFHVRSGSRENRDAVRRTFEGEADIRFAGRVLVDPVAEPRVGVRSDQPGAPRLKSPVLYTENIFVKLDSNQKPSAVRKILSAYKLKLEREFEHLQNGFFLKAPEGTGLDVFKIALNILHSSETVEFCHPELIRERGFRGAFPAQWH